MIAAASASKRAKMKCMRYLHIGKCEATALDEDENNGVKARSATAYILEFLHKLPDQNTQSQ